MNNYTLHIKSFVAKWTIADNDNAVADEAKLIFQVDFKAYFDTIIRQDIFSIIVREDAITVWPDGEQVEIYLAHILYEEEAL